MYGNPPIGAVLSSRLWESRPPLDKGWRARVTCGGQRGRVPETQGFPVLSFGDPLRQVDWLSLPLSGQPAKEPDSGLRSRTGCRAQVLTSDSSVLGEHRTSWICLGLK